MGSTGYKKLTDERKENYKKLKEEMGKIADKYGERLLEVKNNPISIGKEKCWNVTDIFIIEVEKK